MDEESTNIRTRTKTGDSNSFVDALSETCSTLGERNVSLTSLLISPPQPPVPLLPSTTTTATEARKRQADSAKLLNSASDDGKLSSRVAGWVKNAANFITFETKPVTTLRRTSSGNIIQRNSPQPALQVKVFDTTDSICSFPNCVQGLNIAVSRFHCRRCNGWYCAQHAGHPSLGMKLVPGTGEPNSDLGVWSRVCQRCFHERYHRYNEPIPYRDRFEQFSTERHSILCTMNEEAQRLQSRLLKLAEYGKKGKKIPFRVYERQIVQWEGDNSSSNCRQCQERFTTVNRKHHCRLCGRLICGEPLCSLFYPLKVHGSEGGEIIDVRICTRCEYICLRRAFLKKELKEPHPLLVLHNELAQVKRQIDDIMPRFNDQLFRFENEMDQPRPIEEKVLSARHEAMAARDTLMVLFRHFESVAKTIRNLPKDSISQESLLCENIHRSAVLYLQDHMFTLQMLPRLDMKRFQRPSEPIPIIPPTPSSDRSTTSSFLPRFFKSFADDRPSDSPIPLPANLSALEEKLEVLYEQKEQLEDFLAEAVKAELFDNVRTLRTSLEEVLKEIASIQKIFRRLD